MARLAPVQPFAADVCVGELNSTRRRATLGATGSDLVSLNDVTVFARDLPGQATTLFLVSAESASVPNLAGSQGTLCLDGRIGRIKARTSSMDGDVAPRIDLDRIPRGDSFDVGMSGLTRYSQAWYRDTNPTSMSNFTAAVRVLLR